MPGIQVSIGYTKKNYKDRSKVTCLTLLCLYSCLWWMCTIAYRNLSRVILRSHQHSAEDRLWSISDVCQGRRNGQEWGKCKIQSMSGMFATFDLGKGCEALCKCHGNKSLPATLKVYSTVNLYVQKNVCIIP